MTQISRDYSTKLLNVDTNYVDLDNKINTITNTNKNGLRDIMMNNAMYDFSGNVVDNEKRNKTVVDAQIEDIDSIINQTNTIYILGSITMVTLLIFSVIIGKE